jgi:hypothetical protein
MVMPDVCADDTSLVLRRGVMKADWGAEVKLTRLFDEGDARGV